jgi:phosphoribosylformylglycinamidine synthase subunit PurL
VPASRRGLAVSVDGNQRWCAVDPRLGTAMLVAESALNVACAGAQPIAVVNCLNFGNPEHPEVMWQLSEAIDGMSEACRGLGLPVVGGNVSLYNESRGRDIHPTPVVSVLGVIADLHEPPPGARMARGDVLVLFGPRSDDLAGSAWAAGRGRPGSRLAGLDIALHGRLLVLMRALVEEGAVSGLHDVSDGGLAVALAEMAVAGDTGFRVALGGYAELFAEGPSRVVASIPGQGVSRVLARAEADGIPVVEIGEATGDRIVIDGLVDMALGDAERAWRTAVPGQLEGG